MIYNIFINNLIKLRIDSYFILNINYSIYINIKYIYINTILIFQLKL